MLLATSILNIGISILIFYFIPLLYNFPKPTGNYGVGLEKALFADQTLPVDIFYPTITTQACTFEYEPQRLAAFLKYYAEQTHLPYLALKFLFNNIYSYTSPKAKIAAGIFPVVLFFPGIASVPFYNLYIEEIVSHGYIVLMFYPPGDTQITLFPDGQTQSLNATLQKIIADNDRNNIYKYRTLSFTKWFNYGQTVLNEIHQLNEDYNSQLYHKLNLQKIAAIGHSHGGSVVIDLVKKNPILKAGINMDGWTYTVNTPEPIAKPFLVMTTAADFSVPFTGGSTGFDSFIKNMQREQPESLIIIPHASHDSFSDMIQLKWPIGKSKTIAKQIANQIKSQLIKFLDQYVGK